MHKAKRSKMWVSLIYLKNEESIELKRIVDPKLKIYSPSGHPRCRWVCFFIGTDLVKSSEWVPSEGESKRLIQTTVIHTTPVHQLMFCEEKNSESKTVQNLNAFSANFHFWVNYSFQIITFMKSTQQCLGKGYNHNKKYSHLMFLSLL